ncbi:hypothetical protein RZE82_07830 [Mollicutes bacterium LVI A0039]|nr:hypothetical protein RZE82_07830 [Mollicutes bacterium LVI A0039]
MTLYNKFSNLLLKDIYVNPWKYRDIDKDFVSLVNLLFKRCEFIYVECDPPVRFLNTNTSNQLLLDVFDEVNSNLEQIEISLEENFRGNKYLTLDNLNISSQFEKAIVDELLNYDLSTINEFVNRLVESEQNKVDLRDMNIPKFKDFESKLNSIIDDSFDTDVASLVIKMRMENKIEVGDEDVKIEIE